MAQLHLQFHFLCFQYPAEKLHTFFCYLENESQHLQQQNATVKH